MTRKPRAKSPRDAAVEPSARSTARPLALVFREVPRPSSDSVQALWRAQLGPLLDQALEDGPDGLELLVRFEVCSAEAHLYDLTLFCDDDGAVYLRGTLERVASFSQGAASGSEDVALLSALNRAYGAWWKTQRKRVPTTRVEPVATNASSPATTVPRYAAIYAPDQYELGKKLSAKASSGLLRIVKAPSAADLAALDAFLPSRAGRFVVELGPSVPLGVLAHLGGVPFVVLAAGRKDWTGLSHLPASVRRLSIRKTKEPTLAELPRDHHLVSMDLDAPRVAPGSPALAHLETLAWTGADDASWASVHPRLRELALRNAKLDALPPSRTVERLLLFKPSGLTSLKGIEGLPNLTYLRLDHPVGMKSLGDLSRCAALATIHLTAAHRMGDLSGLHTAPRLTRLGVVQSQLDGKPFEGLAGRLVGGSFQLRSTSHGKALLAHLGVPFFNTLELEHHLFDER
ncbi:MAG: hypothetical protein J0L92_36535 [Deltaproteobacteria bacterium]|nr:hypothetical protein [Deltaproteobacteria bacterium]